MKPKRMTGIDYRREMHLIRQTERSLDVHVTERLIELAQIHPEAIIVKMHDDEVKAKSLDNKAWVAKLPIEERISYIEAIEAWSSENVEKAVQMKI